MTKTKIIGITGGIGSGKSTVSKFLENKGFVIYYSDLMAKWVMNNDKKVKQHLIEAFGQDSFTTNNLLNTKYIAQKVFNDSEKLRQLNDIVHPVVRQNLKTFVNQSSEPFILVENAILFESGFNKLCDYIICVTAPVEVRIKRVMQRDGTNRAQVLSRINSQWSDQQKIAQSDFIITNDSWELTVGQINQLITTLTQKFSVK